MLIDDLVDQPYQARSDAAGERQTSRDQLVIQLNLCDLPKLANHGILKHDRDGGAIEYRPDKQTEAVLCGLPEEPSLTDM